jgi:D-alanyl-D-alanine carboxypeptidase
MDERIVALLVCAVLLPGTAAAFAADTLRPDQIAAVDAAVRQAIKEHQIPSVVIGVNRNGKLLFGRAWGKRNLADNLPANIDTLYQYGSITKQITAMSIFLLAQDGKLSLDDEIGKYPPPFSDKPGSIRQVLLHTSGLADFTDAPDYLLQIASQLSIGTEWGLKWAASHLLDFPPGTKAQYIFGFGYSDRPEETAGWCMGSGGRRLRRHRPAAGVPAMLAPHGFVPPLLRVKLLLASGENKLLATI